MVPLTRTELLVLDACRNASRDNPLTRTELKDITKMNDRESRSVVGCLRDLGYRIAHSKKGYWYASPEEYAVWVRRYTANAFTILKRKEAMDRMVEGQLERPIERSNDETTKANA